MTSVPQYYEVAATRIMRDLPRFGHTSTFAYVTGSKEQQKDYIFGLLFAGCFVIAFFLAWTVLLAICKCLGQRRVGFLSGQPFRVAPEESSSNKRPERVRASFIVAAVVLVIFSVLLVTEGLTQIKTGVNSVYQSSVEFSLVVTEANALVEAVQYLIDSRGIDLREDVLSQLEGEFCASDTLEASTGVNFTALAENVSNSLEQLHTFYEEDLENLDESLDELEDLSSNAEDTSEAITLSSWQSLIFIIPFPIFCTLLTAGVLLAWCDRSYRWYSWSLAWIVLPLFFILVIVCYILSGAVAIGASGNADFCSGGHENTPQETILEIMLLNGYTKDDLVFQVVEFYVTTCVDTAGDPLAFMSDFKADLEAARDSAATLEQAIENVTVDELTALCGNENFTSVQNLLASMETTADEMFKLVATVVELFQCERLLPLFTHAFWDGTCQYSVQGATWTFSSFLVIAAMGMLMITFRSSLLLTEDVYVDELKTVGLEYDQGQEVEYDPSKVLSPQNEHAPEQPPIVSDGNVEVTMGIAAGTAAVGGAASGAAMTNDDEHEAVDNDSRQATPADNVSGVAAVSSDSAAGIQDNGHGVHDDSNWLDVSSSPTSAQS